MGMNEFLDAPCPGCAEKDKELERVIAEREWAMNATDDEQLTAATKRIEELERALDRLAQGTWPDGMSGHVFARAALNKK